MTEWSKLKVPELKAELKKRGLPQSGLKADLVARLTTIDNESGFESEATIKGDQVGTSPELNSQTSVADDPKTPQTESQDDGKILIQSRQPAYENAAPSPTSISQASAVAVPNLESYESPVPSTVPTELSTTKDIVGPPSHMSVMSSGYLKEVVEDTQKRKRRSQSPPLSSVDGRSKRARPEHGLDVTSNVEIAAKGEVAMSATDALYVREDKKAETAVSSVPEDLPATDTVDISMEDVEAEPAVANTSKTSPDDGKGDNKTSTSDNYRGAAPVSPHPSRDRLSSCYKPDPRMMKLLADEEVSVDDRVAEKSSAQLNFSKAADSTPVDRSVAPSIHSATSALYIRDFMRPLNRTTLQEHIENLATAPGTALDPEIIVDFYLDPIRTHAFVSFKSVSAASRVRSELHDRIWPNETNRKPLWVDFIPSETVRDWIAEEESSARGARSVAKKWEVVYNTDDYRDVTAMLQEVGSFVAPARKPAVISAPSAVSSRAGIEGAPSGPRSQQVVVRATPIRAQLDQLFKSTTAQPVLYYQPVSQELAEKRLDHLEDATSKRYDSQDPPSEINRYTFEEGDALVDRGPEIFSGIRPPQGHRGRGGGGRGGPRGGGYRDRLDVYRDRGERYGDRDDRYGGRGNGYGSRGDGYRGRGDGYRSRGDGYRGRGGRYEGAGRDMRDSRDRRY